MRRLFIVFIASFLPMMAMAQDYPASLTSYVNDYADIIDADTEARITQTLTDLRETKGVEMTVVTINSTADYGDKTDVPTFTTGLFNHWGVGDAAKNNGIMFLVSKFDREMFIGLGSGYPREFDKRMDYLFDQHVKSHFQKGDYSKGIEIGVTETIERTADNWVEPQTPLLERIAAKIVPILIPFVFLLFFLFILFRNKMSDTWVRTKSCPNCGRRGLSRDRETTQTVTRTTPGEQILRTRCRHCDYRDDHTHIIPVRSSSSSGGGGSFGGGGSSGGGGGGRW
ncbi:TPM domain-containing protein [Paramylibacter kogurei]|nr:TPM domain-containing protein [Amylibacter kogurei]